MAELHVEPKKRSAGLNWVWIVIALLVIGVVVYFLTRNNNNKTMNNGNATNGTSTSWLMQVREVQWRNAIINRKAMLS